jgi:hypothetical protein
MFLSNVVSSQMARFLLPVFAVALVMAFAGAEYASKLDRPLLRLGCAASVAAFLMFGAASFATYAKDFLPVSLGLETRDRFLARMSPNYPEVSFINTSLADESGTALIFFRHVYYLRVNYLEGDPQSNWQMHPDQVQTPKAMLDWLRKYNIRWVVKTGDLPASVIAPLEELRAEGVLQPVVSAQTDDISSWRIKGERIQVAVQILEVRPAKP